MSFHKWPQYTKPFVPFTIGFSRKRTQKWFSIGLRKYFPCDTFVIYWVPNQFSMFLVSFSDSFLVFFSFVVVVLVCLFCWCVYWKCFQPRTLYRRLFALMCLLWHSGFEGQRVRAKEQNIWVSQPWASKRLRVIRAHSRKNKFCIKNNHRLPT